MVSVLSGFKNTLLDSLHFLIRLKQKCWPKTLCFEHRSAENSIFAAKHHLKRACYLIFILLLPPYALAAPPTLQNFTYNALYIISWGGIDVGTMIVSAKEDNTHYVMRVLMKAKGFAWKLTRLESDNTIRGFHTGRYYTPQFYESFFSLRGRTRHITLSYDKQGNLMHETNTPAEKRDKRPEVPVKEKRDALDMLTPFFAQRPLVQDALNDGDKAFQLKLYDGRRLSDATFRVKDRIVTEWQHKQTAVIRYALTTKPLAGYTKDELPEPKRKFAPDISLYLSDDSKMIPLKLAFDSNFGTLYANYAQSCKSLDACIKQMK